MLQSLSSRIWDIQIHPQTGALEQIAHPSDGYGMNWVCNSQQNSWFMDSHGWGLGFLNLAKGKGVGGIQRWQRPVSITSERNIVRASYELPTLKVKITREIKGNRILESFEFCNRLKSEQVIAGIGLYSPFNDNYPSAEICVKNRCNAHLWCGGDVAYACCLRMGGGGPHLGMVFREGFVSGYSIEDRGRLIGGSNSRGTFVFNLRGRTLGLEDSYRVEREFFWHQGWDDFFEQARSTPGFADVRAQSYTVVNGSPIEIISSVPDVKVQKPKRKNGEQTIKVYYGPGRETWLRINVIDDIAALVKRRVSFICSHQQVTNEQSPYHGALVPYDNDLNAQFCNPHWPDQNEGRERVGMGVLLALALQIWHNPETEAALRLYHQFVRRKLQTPSGMVLTAVAAGPQRLYNYPWVAQFHLELYRAFNEKRYLKDCLKTLQAYYRRGGEKFYAIGIPMQDAVETFTSSGCKLEVAALKKKFLQHGDAVVATGLNFPAHEVNYEQTIVGPAVNIALDCYFLSGEDRYLDCARQLLPALEAFNGRQPDHHLHEVAIRHWDGYWFGRKQIWGDTFPHYWSALTGWVFYRYWQATGDESYRRRGREILLNNLSAFSNDGRGSCAYLYPDAINGTAARCWDPLANDQDWALVFLLNAARIDPTLLL